MRQWTLEVVPPLEHTHEAVERHGARHFLTGRGTARNEIVVCGDRREPPRIRAGDRTGIVDLERIVADDGRHVHPEFDAADELDPHCALKDFKILLVFLVINLDEALVRKLQQLAKLCLRRALTRVVRAKIDIEQIRVGFAQGCVLGIGSGSQNLLQRECAVVRNFVMEAVDHEFGLAVRFLDVFIRRADIS